MCCPMCDAKTDTIMRMNKANAKMERRIAELEAEVRRLRELLQPLAHEWMRIGDMTVGTCNHLRWCTARDEDSPLGRIPFLSIHEFRRAYEALNRIAAEDKIPGTGGEE